MAGPAGAAVHEALDHQRQSPLHAAAFAGSLAAVRAILAHAGRAAAAQTAIQAPLGAEAAARAVRYVDWQDRLGWTALHLAAKQGHAAVVALLADEAGARLDTADARQGATPLHDAVRGGSPATVDALLLAGDLTPLTRGLLTELDALARPVGLVAVSEVSADRGRARALGVRTLRADVAPLELADELVAAARDHETTPPRRGHARIEPGTWCARLPAGSPAVTGMQDRGRSL